MARPAPPRCRDPTPDPSAIPIWPTRSGVFPSRLHRVSAARMLAGWDDIPRKIRPMSSRLRRIGFSLLVIVLPAPAPAPDGEPATPPAVARSETLVRADGGRIAGEAVGPGRGRLRVPPRGAATPLPLEPGAVVAFEGPGPDPSSGFPPFQLDLGLGQRVSGRLGSVTESTIHLDDGPGGRPIALPRDAARALLQRAGEAQVFRDGFEAIESERWARIGDPEIVDEPRTEGEHSLRVPAGGTSLTCRLPEPVGSGRLEIAYHDTLVVAPGPAMRRRPDVPGARRAPRRSAWSSAGPRRAWRSSLPGGPPWPSSTWPGARDGIA